MMLKAHLSPVENRKSDLKSEMMPSLLDDLFWPSLNIQGTSSRLHRPAVDVHEYKDKFVLKADLPGFEEDEIKLEIVDGNLVLEGTREKETSEDGADEDRAVVLVSERSQTSFRRVFALGDGIQFDQVEASFRNGTLTITLPKAERALPRKIQIKN